MRCLNANKYHLRRVGENVGEKVGESVGENLKFVKAANFIYIILGTNCESSY